MRLIKLKTKEKLLKELGPSKHPTFIFDMNTENSWPENWECVLGNMLVLDDNNLFSIYEGLYLQRFRWSVLIEEELDPKTYPEYFL